jgi:ATP-dependent NAD(P)H-hydrate dehydratase
MTSKKLLDLAQLVIPPLSSALHKGQCGRIGIIGGSKEYTGAPYLAAIAALRTGADIVHVFCPPSAATVIKGFSPDLVVHPLLVDSSMAGVSAEAGAAEIAPWLSRLHVLIVGPGLGRDDVTMDCVGHVITQARALGLPLVLDADGLFLLSQRPQLLEHYPCAILTPNVVEV